MTTDERSSEAPGEGERPIPVFNADPQRIRLAGMVVGEARDLCHRLGAAQQADTLDATSCLLNALAYALEHQGPVILSPCRTFVAVGSAERRFGEHASCLNHPEHPRRGCPMCDALWGGMPGGTERALNEDARRVLGRYAGDPRFSPREEVDDGE